MQEKEILWLNEFATPLGAMRGAADAGGLRFLHWADAENKYAAKLLVQTPPANIRHEDNAVLALLRRELAAYFSGESARFTAPLSLAPHSAFRRRVWQAVRGVAPGQTCSYAALAARAGLAANFTRAAANAVGQNAFLLLIPCHRIIGADGCLTGYHGGLARKQELLAHEQRCFTASACAAPPAVRAAAKPPLSAD